MTDRATAFFAGGRSTSEIRAELVEVRAGDANWKDRRNLRAS